MTLEAERSCWLTNSVHVTFKPSRDPQRDAYHFQKPLRNASRDWSRRASLSGLGASVPSSPSHRTPSEAPCLPALTISCVANLSEIQQCGKGHSLGLDLSHVDTDVICSVSVDEKCDFAYYVRYGSSVMDVRRVWESPSCQHLMCHLDQVGGPASTHQKRLERRMHLQALGEQLFKVRRQGFSPHLQNGIVVDTWQGKHIAEASVDAKPVKEVTHILLGNKHVRITVPMSVCCTRRCVCFTCSPVFKRKRDQDSVDPSTIR